MDECGICLHAVENEVALNCGHRFCHNCISQVLKKTKPKCTVCRCDIALTDEVGRLWYTDRQYNDNFFQIHRPN